MEKKNRKINWTIIGIIFSAIIVLIGVLVLTNRNTTGLKLEKKGSVKAVEKDRERKSVLNIYAEDVTGSFNPAYALNFGDQVVAEIVYEPLMKRNLKGELEKNLIKKLDISKDGKIYTIALKNNLKFSDGSEVTVKDVFASIAAMAVAQNDQSNLKCYEQILGMDEFAAEQKEFPRGFVELSSNEFQIIFTEASADNLLVLETLIQKGATSETASAREIVNEILQHFKDGIGTGAYAFTETSAGSLCTLKENENYREKIKDISQIEFCSMDYYDMLENVEKSAIDIAIYEKSSALYDVLYDWKGFSVYSKPETMVYAIYYNQNQTVLKDVRVRQAIAHSFNRSSNKLTEVEKYLDFEEGIGFSTEGTKSSGICEYNVSKAKRLLKKADAKGISLKLPIIKGNEMQKSLAEALKADLNRIGIELIVNELSQEDYIQTLYLTMDFDLYLSGTMIDDSVESLKALYIPEGNLPINVQDAEIKTAYEELVKSFKPSQVRSAKEQFYVAIEETAPVLVLGRSRNFISVSADLSGFESVPHQILLSEIHKIKVK